MPGFSEDQMRGVRWELWISQEVQGNHGSSLQQLASPHPDLLLPHPEDPFGSLWLMFWRQKMEDTLRKKSNYWGDGWDQDNTVVSECFGISKFVKQPETTLH